MIRMDNVLKFIITAFIFGGIDLLWLGVIASNFYKSQIGNLMLAKPNLLPAVLFYIIFIIGILVFVINPALNNKSLAQAVGMGALFGFIAYCTYDLTNMATLKGWSWKLVIVDIVWGAIVTASTSGIAYTLIKYFSSK